MGKCENCGAPVNGKFCAECGTQTTQVRDASDAPTSMGASYAANESRPASPTQARTEPARERRPSAQQDDDAPAWWSTGAAAPAAQYHSAPTQEATGGRQPQRRSKIIPVGAALAALIAVGAGSFLVLHKKDAPAATSSSAPSVATGTHSSASRSSTPTTSISTSASAPSSESRAPAPGDNRSNDATTEAPAPAPSEEPSYSETSETPSPSETTSNTPSEQPSESSPQSVSDVPGIRNITDMNGVTYGSVLSGGSVKMYSSDNPSSPFATVPLQGSGSDLSLANVSGCSKPIIVYNSSGKYSAAYGWNGSSYMAYVTTANHEDLGPTLSPSGKLPTPWGVNTINGGTGVEYRDKQGITRGHGNMFTSCSSSSPDVLHWDKP